MRIRLLRVNGYTIYLQFSKAVAYENECIHFQTRFISPENISILHRAFNQCLLMHIQLGKRTTKPTKWHMRTEKTQISLGIRPGWSESSLSAWRKLVSLATHWAHSEVSDQTWQMPRLIGVFAGSTCHFAGSVMRWLISLWIRYIW